MIRAEYISRSFGRLRALNNLNFTSARGEILGIMGANGAGKSTLFQILATLDPGYEGMLSMEGLDARKHRLRIRRSIGYVPGQFSLYGDLTIRENLLFFSSVYGCRAENMAEIGGALWEGLAPFAHRQARHLSGGMKQKLSLCCALVHNPSILLLDEPTTGIDPRSRLEIWDVLKSLKQAGKTILVSTHYMDEACFADRLLLLHRGEQLSTDAPQSMIASYEKKLVSVTGAPAQQLYQVFSIHPDAESCYLYGNSLHMVLPGDFDIRSLDVWGTTHHTGPLDIRPIRPEMEDVFMDRIRTHQQSSAWT